MHQLTIPEFLAYLELDTTPTKDLDSAPVQSLDTKLELLTSAYLDSLTVSASTLTVEQASILKALFELAR